MPGYLGQLHLIQHLFRISKALAVIFKHAVEDTPGGCAFNKFFQSNHMGAGYRGRQIQLKFPIALVTQASAESIDGCRTRPTNLGQRINGQIPDTERRLQNYLADTRCRTRFVLEAGSNPEETGTIGAHDPPASTKTCYFYIKFISSNQGHYKIFFHQ